MTIMESSMDITTTLHYIKDHAQWYDYLTMIITVLIFIDRKSVV